MMQHSLSDPIFFIRRDGTLISEPAYKACLLKLLGALGLKSTGIDPSCVTWRLGTSYVDAVFGNYSVNYNGTITYATWNNPNVVIRPTLLKPKKIKTKKEVKVSGKIPKKGDDNRQASWKIRKSKHGRGIR